MTDEALLAWIERAESVAALLVAIGVAAEFGIQFAARPIRHRMEIASNERIAHSEARAAEAELSLAELKEQAKPRSIGLTARAAMLAVLREDIPTGFFQIGCVAGGSSESCDFAEHIAGVLREAGWIVSGVEPALPFGPRVGISIRVGDVNNPPAAAVRLKTALLAGEFEAVWGSDGRLTQRDNPQKPVAIADIQIGGKP